jgi:hypothetical protein
LLPMFGTNPVHEYFRAFCTYFAENFAKAHSAASLREFQRFHLSPQFAKLKKLILRKDKL